MSDRFTVDEFEPKNAQKDKHRKRTVDSGQKTEDRRQKKTVDVADTCPARLGGSWLLQWGQPRRWGSRWAGGGMPAHHSGHHGDGQWWSSGGSWPRRSACVTAFLDSPSPTHSSVRTQSFITEGAWYTWHLKCFPRPTVCHLFFEVVRKRTGQQDVVCSNYHETWNRPHTPLLVGLKARELGEQTERESERERERDVVYHLNYSNYTKQSLAD